MVLVLALMLCSVASAEEMPFEGTWVQFEDGFQVSLPSDWLQIETTDEMLENGIFYVAASPDGARTVQIAWAETQVTTIEDLQAALVTVYPDAAAIEINGVGFVACEDTANDVAILVALDAEGSGMYMFNFTPASDEEFAPIAQAIASSISNY